MLQYLITQRREIGDHTPLQPCNSALFSCGLIIL
uniref:Uncharacterized protein n=1 Tax=Anguilla anguilla TaxID=7936 RepID=A0A0E9T0E1_ANGAN